MASLGWQFPSNNNGREDGLNDPGIETFKDDPLQSLSREGTQNTCDAHDAKSGKPVELHFDLLELPTEQLPDVETFVDVLKRCAKYWQDNAAATRFFRKALRVMSADTVRVLRMSDYNTSGLGGPVDDKTSDWFKLTKAVGSSDKAGGAGGSFGIGKHAPFACSDLRTVLYGTKDAKGKFAFQGVSKLVTHENKKGETTQGTGYFGVTTKNAPITEPGSVDKLFRRSRTGTDVFILGFLKDADWADQITKGVIESFFASIHESKLLVKVGSTLINKNSLPELVEKYSAIDSRWSAGAYYQALTSEQAALFEEADFEGLGRLEMRVLPGKSFPKRVAMVRSTGMKIYEKAHFQTPVRFAGVFVARGEELNEVLKSMEPPKHDKWEEKRAESPSYARGVLRSLNGWVHDKVRSLSDSDSHEELDAEGVSQYLPDDFDDAERPPDVSSEGEKSAPTTDIQVIVRPQTSATEQATGAATGASSGDDDDTTAIGPDVFDGDGDGEGSGGDGGVGGGNGEEESSQGSTGEGPAPYKRPISLSRVRVYCADPKEGRYRVLAEPDFTGKGFLVLHVVGEVGQDLAPIQEVILGGVSSKPVKAGTIGPLTFTAGTRFSLDVVLEGALRCALGVTAHAG